MYLYDDTKEIEWIVEGTGEEAGFWKVGRLEITKIIPVQVSGEMGYVTWFEVYKGNKLFWRVNQSFVSSIKYKEVL